MTKPKKPQVPAPPPPMPPAAGSATGHWLSESGRDWRPIPSAQPSPKRSEREERLEQLLGLGGLRSRDQGPVEAYDEWGQAHRGGYHGPK